MKKIIIALSVITLFVIQACNSPSSDSNALKSENDSVVLLGRSIADFTKSFSGTINGKYKIEMILIKKGNTVSGNYKYLGKENSLKITGTIDNEGNFTINEFNYKGSMTGIFTGQLNGIIALGQWSKPDGSRTMPFNISETGVNSNNVKEGNVVSCSEQENKTEQGADPVIVKTCLFRNFKTVSTGNPDYKGRYSYKYELYKKQNEKYVKVNNSALFNQDQNQLVARINQKIQKDYKTFSTNPETKDCFEGMTIPVFTLDELGIYFEDNTINFSVTFGLSSACMSVDGTIISFTFDEIRPYLNTFIPLSDAKEQTSFNSPAPLNTQIIDDIGQRMIVIITEQDLKPAETTPKVLYSILTESFKRCGYSYAATLSKIATEGFRPEQTQLIVFLLLPVAKLKNENYSEVYSGQELIDVNKIVKMIKLINE